MTLGQIQNLDPHRLMSRLNPRPLQATLSVLGYIPIDVWIQKMDAMVMADDQNGGKQISAGQVRRLERELKRGDGLARQTVGPDCQELLTDP